MVLSVKGMKVMRSGRIKNHVEVKDKGPNLGSSSFRRLRRLLTACAVKNTYISKVHRLKDGKPYVKRRLRLQLDSDDIARCIEVKEKVRHSMEYNCIMKTLPTTNQRVEFVPKRVDSLPMTWYKVTLSGKSIALEGVMLKLNMRDASDKGVQ